MIELWVKSENQQSERYVKHKTSANELFSCVKTHTTKKNLSFICATDIGDILFW